MKSIILICLASNQIQNAECNVLCKRDGYSGGYHRNGCVCQDLKGPLTDFIDRRVRLGEHEPDVKVKSPADARGSFSVIFPNSKDYFEDTE